MCAGVPSWSEEYRPHVHIQERGVAGHHNPLSSYCSALHHLHGPCATHWCVCVCVCCMYMFLFVCVLVLYRTLFLFLFLLHSPQPLPGLPYEHCMLVYRYFFPATVAIVAIAFFAVFFSKQVNKLYLKVKNEKLVCVDHFHQFLPNFQLSDFTHLEPVQNLSSCTTYVCIYHTTLALLCVFSCVL